MQPSAPATLEAAKAVEKLEALAPPALTRSNAIRKAECDRMREEIRRILHTHPGAKPPSARAVLRELSSRSGVKTLALRTIQWHLHAIRNATGLHESRSEVVGAVKVESKPRNGRPGR